MLHYGHIEILKRASKFGDKLIVGLSTDEFNITKGKECKIPFVKRKELLESIEFVDEIIPESNWDQKTNYILNHNADVFVMGDDWEGKFDDLKKYCEVVYLPRTVDISTTQLKKVINNNNLILEQLIKALRLIISPKKNLLLYHSFPDFSDNCFSFFCYVVNNHNHYKNVWLVNTNEKSEFKKTVKKYTASTNFKIYKKKSLFGLYYYCRSKYHFHTHGIFNNINLSKKQVNVNLWHGMPLKKIGHLDNNKIVPKSNYTIATSKLFQDIMGKAFALGLDNVLISGQPRNDFIFDKTYSLLDLINKHKSDFDKVALWMPTYRKSKIGDVRIDGELDKLNDFLDETYLSELNNFFKRIKSVCFIKLHPMDYMDVNDFNKYSNLYFLNNTHFQEKGISLYSILNNTDLLLTDFSSIYIDYLLLNKPIAFLVSDFSEYSNSRGFVFDTPKKYMPGEIINQRESLIPFLEEIFMKKEDTHLENRLKVNELLHQPKRNFSENVFNSILKSNA